MKFATLVIIVLIISVWGFIKLSKLPSRSVKLLNGQTVRKGTRVRYINSDGEEVIDTIKVNKKGFLYFWNADYNINDYKNIEIVKDC